MASVLSFQCLASLATRASSNFISRDLEREAVGSTIWLWALSQRTAVREWKAVSSFLAFFCKMRQLSNRHLDRPQKSAGLRLETGLSSLSPVVVSTSNGRNACSSQAWSPPLSNYWLYSTPLGTWGQPDARAATNIEGTSLSELHTRS